MTIAREHRVALSCTIDATGIDSCIRDEKYEGWIDEAREAGEKAGVGQTPTVVVDGKAVSN